MDEKTCEFCGSNITENNKTVEDKLCRTCQQNQLDGRLEKLYKFDINDF